MKHLRLVGIFTLCLLLKLSVAAGADVGVSGKVDAEANHAADTSLKTGSSNDSEKSFPIPTKSEKSASLALNQSGNEPTEMVFTTPSMNTKSYMVSNYETRTSISPMAGVSLLSNAFSNYSVVNTYSLGVGVEFPINQVLSTELEGGYGKYNISYGPISHGFNQYSGGASLKAYLFQIDTFHPYIGAGIAGLGYDGVVCGIPSAACGQIVGAGEFYTGADLGIAKGFAIGTRAAWVVPVLNAPSYQASGSWINPGDEERAAMASNYFAFTGDIKVSF